ncbi:MAG: hypothetical protein KAR15_16745 [Desulfobacterales bacterium]|nr:hypothetical protein [Desulfobacterales bacterium]
MAASKNKTPDFFKDESFDPVEVATGQSGPGSSGQNSEKPAPLYPGKSVGPKTRTGQTPNKKKAGFYVSVDLLDRFTRKFYELKLAGAAIENKSALLELALSFALDDLDKGAKSRVLQIVRTE